MDLNKKADRAILDLGDGILSANRVGRTSIFGILCGAGVKTVARYWPFLKPSSFETRTAWDSWALGMAAGIAAPHPRGSARSYCISRAEILKLNQVLLLYASPWKIV